VVPSCWQQGGPILVASDTTPKKDRADFYEGGTVPWVTSAMLNSEFVRQPSGFITEKALKETAVKLWPAHTLLLAMYGEGRTRGKCSELLFESTTNQACAAMAFSSETDVLRPWVKLHLTASYEANRRRSSGGVQPNLSLGFVKNLLVPVPPLEEQQRIIEDVQRRLSVIDELRAGLERNLRRAEGMHRSILHRAFSGELLRPERGQQRVAQFDMAQT